MRADFEVYTLTCNTIRRELKSKIKGYIKVEVKDDTLHICIDIDGFIFNYDIEDYLMTIVAEKLTTDDIVNNIERTMMKAVMCKYFY